MATEAEIRMLWPQVKECCSPRGLDEAGVKSQPKPWRQHSPVGPLPSRTVAHSISVVDHQVCHLSQQPKDANAPSQTGSLGTLRFLEVPTKALLLATLDVHC